MTPEYERRERLERLASASADRPVLVTLTIPPGNPLGEALRPIETDYVEATSGDERITPSPLVAALDALREQVKEYETVPADGLVAYAGAIDMGGDDTDGAVDGDETDEVDHGDDTGEAGEFTIGDTDKTGEFTVADTDEADGPIAVAVFDDLPSSVGEFRYERETEFDLEPIAELLESSGPYGLLVVERTGAALGRLDDGSVELLETFDSDVPGKSGAGGQSIDRSERGRERAKRGFFEEVGERAERTFLEEESVETVFLGGTEGIVEEFREAAALDDRLAERFVDDSFTVEYATEQGVRRLAERGSEAIAERDRHEARRALERFFEGLEGDQPPVAYGRDAVDDALAYDAVETVALSTSLSPTDRREFGDRAAEQGGDAVVVPEDFRDGERFAEAFGGVGAVLRFPIE